MAQPVTPRRAQLGVAQHDTGEIDREIAAAAGELRPAEDRDPGGDDKDRIEAGSELEPVCWRTVEFGQSSG